MHRTNGPLCPVQTFVNIIHRVLTYPNQDNTSTINMVRYGNEIVRVASKVTLQHIRNTVALIGEDTLYTFNQVFICNVFNPERN